MSCLCVLPKSDVVPWAGPASNPAAVLLHLTLTLPPLTPATFIEEVVPLSILKMVPPSSYLCAMKPWTFSSIITVTLPSSCSISVCSLDSMKYRQYMLSMSNGYNSGLDDNIVGTKKEMWKWISENSGSMDLPLPRTLPTSLSLLSLSLAVLLLGCAHPLEMSYLACPCPCHHASPKNSTSCIFSFSQKEMRKKKKNPSLVLAQSCPWPFYRIYNSC